MSHQESTYRIKNIKGIATSDVFVHLGTPTARLKISPIDRKRRLIPNRWIWDDLVSA